MVRYKYITLCITGKIVFIENTNRRECVYNSIGERCKNSGADLIQISFGDRSSDTSQGLNMVMRDFKEKDHRLIMLRPSTEILQSVQSLSQETIDVVNTDAELVATLKELNTGKRVRETGEEVIDLNGKSADGTRDELPSTKL